MKPKRPLPPGVTTSDIDYIVVDFTQPGPSGAEDEPDRATVHLKTGSSFSVPVADVKSILLPENVELALALPGGLVLKYSPKPRGDEHAPSSPSIELRMVRISFGISVNFPRGFDSQAFFELGSEMATNGSSDTEMLEQMLPTDELLTEPMRRLVALQCVELEHAKRLLAEGDARGAEHHLLIAEEFSSEFMKLADALPSPYELRSSKAGKALAARNEPLRRECARLLREQRPPEGWESHEVAACTIASRLSEFVEHHPELTLGLGEKGQDRPAPNQLDLVEIVRRWIGRDLLIRQAYSGSLD